MNARQKKIGAIVETLREEYHKQEKPLFEFGIEKLTLYMKAKKRSLLTASEYNLYRDAIEKFLGVK